MCKEANGSVFTTTYIAYLYRSRLAPIRSIVVTAATPRNLLCIQHWPCHGDDGSANILIAAVLLALVTSTATLCSISSSLCGHLRPRQLTENITDTDIGR